MPFTSQNLYFILKLSLEIPIDEINKNPKVNLNLLNTIKVKSIKKSVLPSKIVL